MIDWIITFPVFGQSNLLQAKLNSSQTFFMLAGSTKPKTPVRDNRDGWAYEAPAFSC